MHRRSPAPTPRHASQSGGRSPPGRAPGRARTAGASSPEESRSWRGPAQPARPRGSQRDAPIPPTLRTQLGSVPPSLSGGECQPGTRKEEEELFSCAVRPIGQHHDDREREGADRTENPYRQREAVPAGVRTRPARRAPLRAQPRSRTVPRVRRASSCSNRRCDPAAASGAAPRPGRRGGESSPATTTPRAAMSVSLRETHEAGGRHTGRDGHERAHRREAGEPSPGPSLVDGLATPTTLPEQPDNGARHGNRHDQAAARLVHASRENATVALPQAGCAGRAT